MNLIELDRALKQLRLGGMAAVLETRLRQAQTEPLAPIDLLSCLVSDELARRGERLIEGRTKQAQFRDSQKTLDNFDFSFNKKMNRSLIFDLAARRRLVSWSARHWQEPLGSGHRSSRPSRATAFSTVRPTPCSMNSPKPRSTAPAKSAWSS